MAYSAESDFAFRNVAVSGTGCALDPSLFQGMIEYGLFDHVVFAFCISIGKRVMVGVQRSLEGLPVSRQEFEA